MRARLRPGVGVSFRRKLSVIALVYVIEGFPMGVYRDVWQVFFGRLGASTPELGLFTGLYFAWALKVFWSPLVDRFGEQRQWIAGALVVMAACLLVLANTESPHIGPALWAVLWVYCLASATQDIAIDAYSIGITERGEEGPVNAIKAGAYRIGLIGAGGSIPILADWVGWSAAFTAATVVSVAFAAAVYTVPRVKAPREARESFRRALSRWAARDGVVPVFLFILLYRIGDFAMAAMVKPFWLARGFTNTEIGVMSTTVGALATIAGALVGGGVVARIGIGRSLWVLGVFALGSNFGYAAAAAWPEFGKAGVYAASIIEAFCGGLAAAGFLSYLMRICEKEHAAVEYALVTALYAAAGSLIGMPSGFFAEALGYAGYFALTAAFALPAFAFLPGARRWIGPEPG